MPKKGNRKTPRVSVLMPIFNTHEAVLRESIESILSQTYKDFEFIILNDSPENTALDNIVAEYKDPRIIYLKNVKNIGLEESTNRLLNESRGEFIAIFDHDDISLPHRLSVEVAVLDNNQDVGVVSGQFNVFGTEKFTSKNPLESDEIRAKLLTDSCVSHTTIMFRRKIIEDNKIKYEKEYFPAASYRIITRLALVTNIINVPEVLVNYRMDGNNTSIKYAKQRLNAREKIRKEYGEGLIKRALLRKGYKVKSVKRLGGPPFIDERRYYKVLNDNEEYFIKSDSKNLENEFRMSKLMYQKNKKYFVEPIDIIYDEFYYFVTRWCEGVTLEDYLKSHSPPRKLKKSMVQDLINISKLLLGQGLVHRDIIPRNFLIESGRLKLIDFNYAVVFNKYDETDYIKNNIRAIADLGESYAAGTYKWDDAFSLTKVAELIIDGDKEITNKLLSMLSKNINKRVLIPSASVLRKLVIDQKREIEDLKVRITLLESENITINSELTKCISVQSAIEKSYSYRVGRLVLTPFRLIRYVLRKIMYKS